MGFSLIAPAAPKAPAGLPARLPRLVGPDGEYERLRAAYAAGLDVPKELESTIAAHALGSEHPAWCEFFMCVLKEPPWVAQYGPFAIYDLSDEYVQSAYQALDGSLLLDGELMHAKQYARYLAADIPAGWPDQLRRAKKMAAIDAARRAAAEYAAKRAKLAPKQLDIAEEAGHVQEDLGAGLWAGGLEKAATGAKRMAGPNGYEYHAEGMYARQVTRSWPVNTHVFVTTPRPDLARIGLGSSTGYGLVQTDRVQVSTPVLTPEGTPKVVEHSYWSCFDAATSMRIHSWAFFDTKEDAMLFIRSLASRWPLWKELTREQRSSIAPDVAALAQRVRDFSKARKANGTNAKLAQDGEGEAKQAPARKGRKFKETNLDFGSPERETREGGGGAGVAAQAACPDDPHDAGPAAES